MTICATQAVFRAIRLHCQKTLAFLFRIDRIENRACSVSGHPVKLIFHLSLFCLLHTLYAALFLATLAVKPVIRAMKIARFLELYRQPPCTYHHRGVGKQQPIPLNSEAAHPVFSQKPQLATHQCLLVAVVSLLIC